MAKIRIGLGSEFNLNNGNLGLGVTNPQVRLDIDGTVKSKDFEVTGVTSFTAYEGFLRSDHQIDGDLTLNTGQGLNASLSGEIIVKDGVTVTVGAIGLGTTSVGVGTELITNTIDSNAVNLAGGSEIECLKVYATFTPPSGGTDERPYAPKPGELYYNYDFRTIEFFDGYGWRQVDNTTQRGRGVVAGGVSPTWDNIEYVNFSTLGNSINFGTLTAANHSQNRGSVSSSTRGLFCGGNDPQVNTIEYITIPSEGNAIDFGNLTTNIQNTAGGSSSTRGINASGYTAPGAVNVIDYVEISTLGNALDFGDAYISTFEAGGVTSPTRMLFAGGTTPSVTSIIQSLTISSKGNSTFFGNLAEQKDAMGCMNSSTRGVFAGREAPTKSRLIEYVTIASDGNSVYFGDLSEGKGLQNGMSSQTRGIIAGGFTPDLTNVMEYITIATTGDAQDFGDLARASRNQGTCSDSHGGLGGF